MTKVSRDDVWYPSNPFWLNKATLLCSSSSFMAVRKPLVVALFMWHMNATLPWQLIQTETRNSTFVGGMWGMGGGGRRTERPEFHCFMTLLWKWSFFLNKFLDNSIDMGCCVGLYSSSSPARLNVTSDFSGKPVLFWVCFFKYCH